MTQRPVRLHLVLSGGASLGAFHGGALAAILTALRPPAQAGLVRVDAMGGTSAGAIAALLAAHAWLEGIDPVWLLHEAWVERVSAELLRTRSDAAPLSFERLRRDISGLLDPSSGDAAVHRVEQAPTPLALHANLLNLHGVTHAIPVDGAARGTSYDDWIQHVLHPGGGVAQLLEPDGCSPLDSVLASAAHPAVFAPVALDRSGEADRARQGGTTDADEPARFFYADGGPMANHPVGRVLQAGRLVRETAVDHLHALVIDPRSQGPTDSTFTGDARPSWRDGVQRTAALLPSQAISEDLRGIGSVNEQLAMIERAAEKVTATAGEDRVTELIELLHQAAGGEGADFDAEADARDRLAHALKRLARVDGKVRLSCDMIAPGAGRDADDDEVLSGNVLGDFGGFLHRRLRRDDFVLGYRCAVQTLTDRADWLRERAEPRSAASVDEGLDAARAAAPEADRTVTGSRSTLPFLADSIASLAAISSSAALGLVRRALPW